MLHRVLHFESDGDFSEVTIEIEYPIEHGNEFACHVLIKGGSFNIDYSIFGIDAMQALTLAIRFARSVVTSTEAHKTGKLYWLEPGADLEPI